MVVVCTSTESTVSTSPQTSVLREGTRQEQEKVNCVESEVLTLLDVHLNVSLVSIQEVKASMVVRSR